MLKINLDTLDEWIEIIPKSHIKTREKYGKICTSIRSAYNKDMASYVESDLQKLYRLVRRYKNNNRFSEFRDFLDKAVAATSGMHGEEFKNCTVTPLAD